MAWHVGKWTVGLACMVGVTACTPVTRAALVPRLVVHLSAADRRSADSLDSVGQDAAAASHHARWDVSVHAELRWRSPQPSSYAWP